MRGLPVYVFAQQAFRSSLCVARQLACHHPPPVVFDHLFSQLRALDVMQSGTVICRSADK